MLVQKRLIHIAWHEVLLILLLASLMVCYARYVLMHGHNYRLRRPHPLPDLYPPTHLLLANGRVLMEE